MESLYLRFADDGEAREVLRDYFVENAWRLASHEHALHVVGVIFDDTGVALEGFHINLQLKTYDGTSFEAWRVHPDSPRVVWA